MSRIYFHSPTEDAEVRGSERAHMGCLMSDILWGFLKHYANEYEGSPAKLRNVLRGGYALDEQYRGREFSRVLELSLSVSDETKFSVGEKTASAFIVSLNTAMRIGDDPLRLFARLHGQCEIHAWVDGRNRRWLSEIIERGLRSGLYRKRMGWESVVELLVKDDVQPVVTSYSVCEQFPNAGVADWEDDSDGDGWYEPPEDQRWSMAMEKLRTNHGKLELRPDDWGDYVFGSGLDAFMVIEAAIAATETLLEGRDGK